MASEEIDNIMARYSVLQSLSRSDLEDSLDRNIHQTQAMWAQIAHAMSRLEEPTSQAEPTNQAAQLQQQKQQLAKMLEEEMTHREQVSVLSHMHLQQVEEIKAQSHEIWQLLALVEQQQRAIENLTSPHSPSREPRSVPSCSETQLDVMREEVFNIIPGTVNTMRGTAVSHNTTMASAPMVNKNSFKDMLAKEVNFTTSCKPKHVTFLDTMGGGVTSSTPQKYQEEVAIPARPTKHHHPEEVGFHVAAHKIRKMWEPKISKLKGGYSSSAGLIFQSWLKDIHVHMEDRRLMQRKAIQLVKDFMAECAWDEVEFYMGMMAEEDQSFKGLIDHLHAAFQLGETLSELISDFMAGLRRPGRPKTPLPMICRCWPERLLHVSHPLEKRPINS